MDIVPLTENNIDGALRLAHKVFPNEKGEDDPDIWFRAALDKGKYREYFEKYKTADILYWLAVEDGRVIGTTGLYWQSDEPADRCWLSWFMVDPAYRRQNIGTQLLLRTIAEAKKLGKTHMRLYTSDHPEEVPAQAFYEKHRYREIGREPHPTQPYTLIYREHRWQP